MSGLADFFGPAGMDTTTAPEVADYSVIPVGYYPVTIMEVCLKKTKANNGHYLEVVFQILDGEFKGRKLWDRFNVQHDTSPKAVEIGRQQLANLARKVGVPMLQQEQQLLNGVCYASVKVKGDNNEIRCYLTQEQMNEANAKASAGQGAAAVAPPAPAAQPQAPVQPPAAVPAQPAVPTQAPVQQAPPVQAPPAAVAQPAHPLQSQVAQPEDIAAQPGIPQGQTPWQQPAA